MLRSKMIQLIFRLFGFCIQVNNFCFFFLENIRFEFNLGFIADRSNVKDSNDYEGSELPEFVDVKMFIDSLLIDYQTGKPIEFEIERTPMRCTSYRQDFIFGKRK